MDGTPFHQEWLGQTTVHPLAFGVLMACAIATLFVPRRFAVLPLIAVTCFISPAQRIALGPLDFNFVRIMLLVGWCRLLVRSELKPFRVTLLDWVVVAWMLAGTMAYLALWQTLAAAVFRLGAMFDIGGMYFLFRFLVRDWDDFRGFIYGFVITSVPVAAAFLFEALTRYNVFAAFGGVPEITQIRDGRVRCQGAFPTAMVAGCFWAALIPLMGALWWRGGAARWASTLGVMAGTLIVILSASATPVMGLLGALAGAACFLLRRQMRWVRWAVVITLLGLHMIMDAPVWHLISRVNIGGSTGWHRFNLVQQAIDHFHEWWLIGAQSTAHWGWLMYDVTNQYILEGVRGGLLTLMLFLAMLAVSFRDAGRLCRKSSRESAREYLAWGIGVTLFVHSLNFIGISYVGQNNVTLFPVLAALSSLSALAHSAKPLPRERPLVRVAVPTSPSSRKVVAGPASIATPRTLDLSIASGRGA